MLKDEIQKGIHLKTPQDSNYWHFPCVMLCTLPFLVHTQYILQLVKLLKCESGNNSTKRVTIFNDDNIDTSLPFRFHVLTCTTFHKGIYWMSEAWVWQYIPEETLLVSKSLQLDIFSAFYVLFYPRLFNAFSQHFLSYVQTSWMDAI